MTTDEEKTKNIGLRGVTVADTKISLVDGERGQLLYRGYAIQLLAKKTTYEEVVFLLLMGRLPTVTELVITRETMAEHRPLPPQVISYLQTRGPRALPMDVLQGAVAVLADHDPDLTPDAVTREQMVRSSLRLVSRIASVAAAWDHLRRGKEPVDLPADPTMSHAAAFLYGLWGREPSAAEARLMDLLLVLHAEHAFNASTFAAREVASTRAHLYASVTAAVGALSGSLHGGANARVMEMLQQIGSTERVEEWVRSRIASGKRVMGLGHAVYRTEDPRAAILRRVAEKTLAGRGEEHWFHLALEVEQVARRLLREHKGIDLYPNVDFYSGSVLYALGLPVDMFPVFFAVSRSAGWCAHVIEEYFAEAQPKPALYRPESKYVGRACGPQGCRWVPLEMRGVGCPCGKVFDACDELEAMRTLGWVPPQFGEIPAEEGEAEEPKPAAEHGSGAAHDPER